MDGEQPNCSMAIVVATHGRPDALGTLLSSLRAQTAHPTTFEVAVVVDGLDEHEAAYRAVLERARHEARYRLSYDFQRNAGQSVARQYALDQTTAPWVCVVDDDMELAPEFIDAHQSALACGPDTVVIGRIVPEPGWERAPLYEAVRNKAMLDLHAALASGAKAATGHALMTGNVSFPRPLFQRVGGFDESLRLGEDTELGLRLERAGATFVFCDAAAAVHRSRVGSYECWLARAIQYGRNAVYMFEKSNDARAHPLRNLVNGSRLNAAVVHALCWSDPLAHAGISALRIVGGALQRLSLHERAIATHKAIQAIAFHLGVKDVLGSWRSVMEAKRAFSSLDGAPRDPT